MASSNLHPRRRPASPSMTPSLLDSFQNMSIRKGDTFHVPHKNDQDLWDPLAAKSKTTSSTPSMPARSTTCPQSLEDLLIGSGERRAADLLHRVDQAIAAQSKLALGHVLSEPEVLPVPTLDDKSTVTRTRSQHSSRSHSSDSGIGSSVASESGKGATTDSPNLSSTPKQSMSTISAVTEERGLSEYAKEQIHLHIIQPILREPSLKEFHQLVKDVPHRIGSKEIKNLRDLEKILIFCAPDYSRTPRKYLHFCERTIRVLHTTVTTLHESDQRAPTDRPYTQGYFFDLVEQIRRYATILAATRQRQLKGEKADEMDYSPEETVSIQGGLAHNGKPAELVRHKDGKMISLATGRTLTAEEVAPASMKRPMSDAGLEDADDDVLRSMARRKKNAKPEIHECPQCDKEFKRPCDLTKHIKTHDRPYKCPIDKCKYHEYGWPTEKECERHVNDKHSSAPSLYHCLYKPCPYTSKRESNCKQHMEKAHGWDYVRSKNNGKGKASEVARLPKGSVPASPASMMSPFTPIAPSPSSAAQSWMSGSRHSSMAPPPLPSNYGTPAFVQPSPDFTGHFNMNFDFNNIDAFPLTPALSEDRRSSSTSDSGMMFDNNAFDNISPNDFSFDTNFNFNDFNLHPSVTPESAVESTTSHFHGHPPTNNGVLVPEQQVSPGAQVADPTFTPDLYDNMNVDDAFSNDMPGQDFTLFGAQPPTTSAGEMFPSLAEGSSWGNFGGQFDSKQQTVRMPTESSVLHELFPELNNH